MIIWQADPNFNNEHHLTDPHYYDAYPDYIKALGDHTAPFQARWCSFTATRTTSRSTSRSTPPSGGVLANFTRVETFGSRNDHWVSATIDATTRTCSVPAADRPGERQPIAGPHRHPGRRRTRPAGLEPSFVRA